MNSKSEPSWEEVKRLVDQIKFEVKGEYLTDVETIALQGSYKKVSYAEINDLYSEAYLKGVGKRIWDTLSQQLGVKVSKTNFLQALVRYKEKQHPVISHEGLQYKQILPSPLEARATPTEEAMNSDPSTEQLPLYSHFHIERPNVESLCYETIRQPGALIRIRSSQKMGKTSVLAKLLDYEIERAHV